MGLYEVPLSMSLLGFRMGTMLANFHVCGIMLVLRAAFNMVVRNASSRGHMCLRVFLMLHRGVLYAAKGITCLLSSFAI